MKTIYQIVVFLLCSVASYSQVGINADNSAPHSSAMLDVKSTTKAFYPPRMSTTEKEAITGKQVGAVVYDITQNQLNIYNGTAWVAVGGAFALPFVGTATVGSGGYVLDIANTTGSDGTAIIGRNSTVITGEGVMGVATATSPLSSVAGVYGRSASTNSNGVGVKAFHAGTGSAFLGTTAAGIGASLTSTSGFALKTQGKLQFAGNGVGTLGIGKILMSTTATGDAQWADLIPISETKSLNSSLISITNTLTSTNSPAIFVSSKSVDTGEAIDAKSSNTAPTGFTVAIRATNESTNNLGAGLHGSHRGSGTGVYGNSYSGIGVYGDGNTGVKGEGIYGIHGIGTQRGVFGEKAGTTGSAIHGVGGLHAVYGQSEGYGVYGVSNYLDPNQYKYAGVYGESNANNEYGSGVNGTHWGNGPGVNGYSPTGIGGRFNSDGGGYALITQTGNVGIGTSTPAAKMDIKGTDFLSHFYYGANEDTYIRGGKAGGNVLINDIAGQGNVGIGVADPAYILDVKDRMRLRANGTNTAGIYLNNAANSTWAAFYGMKTDTQSGIFIGGNWRFWVDNTGAGFLNGNLIQTSDKRLKKDFSLLSNSLTDIYKLNGYHFRWIEEARNKELQTGLMAQEVQKIFPELVQTDDKGMLSVNYIGLIPHLIEALKTLKDENTLLKSNNEAVNSRLQKIEDMLQASLKD